MGVISPLSVSGSFWETMIHALSALWKNKNVILDTCEVFVKDQLLDWLKEARKMYQTELEEGNEQYMKFYPMRKI